MENMWYPVAAVMLSILAIAGFSAMEAGMARAKNAGNTVVKCAVGFMISIPAFMLSGQYIASMQNDVIQILPAMAAGVVITNIIAGAVSERIKLSAYSIVCLLIAAVIYPFILFVEHKVLQPAGLHDFSGLSTLSLAGGAAAFFSARSLGARTGKYSGGRVSRAMPGHNIPLGVLGMLLLVFCSIGYTGCSILSNAYTLQESFTMIQQVLLLTSLAGLTALLVSWARYKKPDITMSISGMLSGAVAGSSTCDETGVMGAAVIAVIIGFCIVFSIENLDQNLHVDDPSGVVSIFCIGGMAGLLGIGLLSVKRGLIHGLGLTSLGVQAFTVIFMLLFMAVSISTMFWLLKKSIGLRLLPGREMEGLDTEENGLISAYHDFTYNIDATDWNDSTISSKSGKSKGSSSEDYTYEYQPDNITYHSGMLTKLEIITRKEKFEELKIALNDIGITGMTVFPVSGCGVQKGYNEVYRGIPLEVQLRPKIRVEVVVAKVPVKEVVNTARKVLNTGHVGDGKIFIHTLEDVVRVRTGEKGYDAMQGGASE